MPRAGLSAQGGLRVLIAGGGTGGHVIPALAIARELRDAHGAEVLFVGTSRGLETKLVPEAGFALDLIRVGQLKSVALMTRLKTLADLPLGMLRCAALLRRFKPDVVIGVGGYVSGPTMLAAIVMRVPTLAFEPNAVPGLANRIVGRFVTAAAVNLRGTKRYFHGAEVTGIPVREEFFRIADDGSMQSHGRWKQLLVFGGSQGARVLNEMMPQIAGKLLKALPTLEIVHQTGGRQGDGTRAAYARAGLVGNGEEDRVRVHPYLDRMPEEFAEADLVLCRSGASTMAELAAAGKASVLVPFPLAADDHQRKNAEAFVEAGAAVLLAEAELKPERLLDVLRELLAEGAPLAGMGAKARELAHPRAVQEIVIMVLRLAGLA